MLFVCVNVIACFFVLFKIEFPFLLCLGVVVFCLLYGVCCMLVVWLVSMCAC